jgi:hypothetical protein
VNRNKDDDTYISINKGPMVELLLKIILICVVSFLPVLIIYMTQDTLYLQIGPPLPTSVPYLILVGVLVIWYLIGFPVLLPRLGKRIEGYTKDKYRY